MGIELNLRGDDVGKISKQESLSEIMAVLEFEWSVCELKVGSRSAGSNRTGV